MKTPYDRTVACIAGNIASGYVQHRHGSLDPEDIAKVSVSIARAIVAETTRTEPRTAPDAP